MTNDAARELRTHSYGPGDFVGTFFRHKKKAVGFALAIAALGTLIILFAPRKYRSEARLFLQVGRESIRLDPTATTGKTIGLQQSGRDAEIATAIEVLKSRAIVEQAVDELSPEVVLGKKGAGKGEPNAVADTVLAPLRFVVKTIKSVDPISQREEAVIDVMENLEVDAEYDSAVIVLTYDAKTPKLAQKVMQTLVDVYREAHVKLHRNSGSKPFFAQQRSELEEQLAAAESDLREAKNRMSLASVDSRRSTLETRLGSIELSRNSTAQQMASTEAKIASLRTRIASMPERMQTSTVVMPNTGADALRSQLYALQVQLMNVEAKYKPDHPMVASTRAQVAEAQQMVAKEESQREQTVDGLNENHRALSLDLAKAESLLAGLQAQQLELDAQQKAAVADLSQLNDYELEIDRLDRAVSLANTNFFRYAEGLEQARMDEELDNQRVTNVNVAQAATFAEKPVSPSKMIVCALSLLLMTAGTTALVLASERFDSRLHGEEQIEQTLQLPVLAAVPESRAYGSLPAAVG